MILSSIDKWLVQGSAPVDTPIDVELLLFEVFSGYLHETAPTVVLLSGAVKELLHEPLDMTVVTRHLYRNTFTWTYIEG